MRILFVRSGNNGTDPISQNQGESLREAGCEVDFFDILGKGLLGYLKNCILLRSEMKSNNHDIIHAHYVYSGILASISLRGKPVVTSLMGSDVNDLNLLGLFIIRVFVRFFWSATIVKTIRMKDKLKEKNAIIIPNGVDLKRFNPIEKGTAMAKLFWDNDRKHVLFGSDPLRIVKNYSLFKRAIEGIKSDPCGIEVHYLKGIDIANVFLYYCAADVLLLTSYSEGSPNVIKEAMACNCPIVSTDVGDVKEIISDTEGCYITTFDPEDICEKIKSALKFGGRTTGREKIKHLSDELIAKKLINVYEEVIDAIQ